MTRNGKIARLPAALREELNQRLRDGEPGQRLAQWLNGLPGVRAVLKAQFKGNPITVANLSQWKNGGYAAWEAGERLAQSVRSIMDGTSALKAPAKDGLTDRMALMLAANIAAGILQLESMPLCEDKAKMWRELRLSLVALRRSELYAERLQIEQAKRAQPGKKKKTKEPILTPEDQRQRMKQILGLGEGYDGSKNPELTRSPAMPDNHQI